MQVALYMETLVLLLVTIISEKGFTFSWKWKLEWVFSQRPYERLGQSRTVGIQKAICIFPVPHPFKHKSHFLNKTFSKVMTASCRQWSRPSMRQFILDAFQWQTTQARWRKQHRLPSNVKYLAVLLKSQSVFYTWFAEDCKSHTVSHTKVVVLYR